MLLSLLLNITVVVLTMTAIGLFFIVGVDTIRSSRLHAIDQIRHVFPYLLLLGGVLLVNDHLRDIGPTLSWIIGWDITTLIISIEGNFIGLIQNYSHPWLTYYFSYVYIYGYIFLLVFPVAAYLLHQHSRPLREVAIAYTLNYSLGIVCYLFFIALGPRNTLIADGLLYTYWPQAQLLTSEVNANVNVFPSLHSSLSATVALLAYRWRDIYWSWFPIATAIAISVGISTMYLGIHWATDVVAGVLLALFCVWMAVWLTRPERTNGRLGRIGVGLRRPVDRRVDFVLSRVLRKSELGHRGREASTIVRMETKIVTDIFGFWTVFYGFLGAGMITGGYQAITAEEALFTVPLLENLVLPLGYIVASIAVLLGIVFFGILHIRVWGWWSAFGLATVHLLVALMVFLTATTGQLVSMVMVFLSLYVLIALWDERGAFSVDAKMPHLAENFRF